MFESIFRISEGQNFFICLSVITIYLSLFVVALWEVVVIVISFKTDRYRMEDLTGLIDFGSEKLIFKSFVQQIIHGGERKRVCFVATDFFIRIFDPQAPPENTLKEVAKFPMCDIRKMDSLDEITLRFTFGPDQVVTIVTDTPSSVLSDIYVNLRTLILTNELPQIEKSVVDSVKNQRFNAYGSVMHRYQATLAWKGVSVSPDALKSVERFLKREPKEIDLGVIEDLGFNLPIFLDSIMMQPMITRLKIPTRPQSQFFQLLADVVESPSSNIISVGIVEAVDEGFYEFMQFLNRIETVKLEEICFENMEVPDTAIEAIQSYLASGTKSISLGFTKCEIRECEKRIVTMIEQCKNLIGVNMTSVWLESSVNVKTTMGRLQKIAMRGCGIQISEVLDVLSRVYTPRVTELDLSQNQCTERISADVALPCSIRKVIVDFVKWRSSNLTAMFQLVCNGLQNAYFSCVRAQLSEKHWQKFFLSLDAFQAPQLSTLIWNENQIHPKICQFLQRASNFEVFCMAGCKVLSEAPLQKLFENHKALVVVDMHGTQSYRLGPGIRPFLLSIRKSKSIRRLDVSHCKMGPAAFAKLVEVVTGNPKVKQLLLDDNDLPTFASLELLCAAIQARAEKGISIYCRFPWKDVIDLVRENKVTSEKINSIKPLFVAPEAPKSSPGWEEWLMLTQQQYPEEVVIEEAKQPVSRSESRPNSPSGNKPFSREHMSCGVERRSVADDKERTGRKLPEGSKQDTNIRMDFFDVKPIDNAQLMQKFGELYSIEALSQRLSGTV